MAEKSERNKARQDGIPIQLAMDGFRKRMLFNRFAVIKDGDYRIMHFGYVTGGNLLMDQFACAIHSVSLEEHRKENFDYLGRLGELSVPGPANWLPPIAQIGVELVTYVGFCRHGSLAEMTLHNFSLKGLLDVAKSPKSQANLVSEAVAVLRSDVEIQKHLIKELYTV